MFFAEQFFKLFDKDKSGTISLSELIEGLTMLMDGTDMDKLRFLFDVYDVDGEMMFKTISFILKQKFKSHMTNPLVPLLGIFMRTYMGTKNVSANLHKCE